MMCRARLTHNAQPRCTCCHTPIRGATSDCGQRQHALASKLLPLCTFTSYQDARCLRISRFPKSRLLVRRKGRVSAFAMPGQSLGSGAGPATQCNVARFVTIAATLIIALVYCLHWFSGELRVKLLPPCIASMSSLTLELRLEEIMRDDRVVGYVFECGAFALV